MWKWPFDPIDIVIWIDGAAKTHLSDYSVHWGLDADSLPEKEDCEVGSRNLRDMFEYATLRRELEEKKEKTGTGLGDGVMSTQLVQDDGGCVAKGVGKGGPGKSAISVARAASKSSSIRTDARARKRPTLSSDSLYVHVEMDLRVGASEAVNAYFEGLPRSYHRVKAAAETRRQVA